MKELCELLGVTDYQLLETIFIFIFIVSLSYLGALVIQTIWEAIKISKTEKILFSVAQGTTEEIGKFCHKNKIGFVEKNDLLGIAPNPQGKIFGSLLEYELSLNSSEFFHNVRMDFLAKKLVEKGENIWTKEFLLGMHEKNPKAAERLAEIVEEMLS